MRKLKTEFLFSAIVWCVEHADDSDEDDDEMEEETRDAPQPSFQRLTDSDYSISAMIRESLTNVQSTE